MRGGESNALDALNRGNIMDQQSQICRRAIVHGTAISIDVLTEQIDLPGAFRGQCRTFSNDVIEGTAEFLTTGIGNNTKCAVFAATFHHGHKSGGALRAWFREIIELFHFWK